MKRFGKLFTRQMPTLFINVVFISEVLEKFYLERIWAKS